MKESSREKTTCKGLPDGWTRATFIVKEEHLQKIKAIAYWERLTVKELLEEALDTYLSHKEIPEIPEKKRRSSSEEM